GSRAVAASKFRADLAIVGEPTRLKVVTAHKGVLWLELQTKGKAAHGARPELGRNAVHEMARVVELLESRYAGQLRRRKHALLGHATVNVGAIRGGNQPNIVPADCNALVDRRLLPGESDAGVMREMAELFRKQKLRVSMRRSHPFECAALETNPANELVELFLRSVGQRSPAGVDYFSDGGVLAQGRIPSVLFGPGDIAQAHTPDEWIDLRQLERAGQMLERFLRALP
ncbi:MAG: peptidase, partial [Acidobacteria bacterium]